MPTERGWRDGTGSACRMNHHRTDWGSPTPGGMPPKRRGPRVRAIDAMARLAGAVLATAAFAVIVAGWTVAPAEPRHGLSAFGDLKYPADFKHFEYVNPDAPKGGRLATIGTAALITFNSLNGYILKGDPAQGLEYLFDSLMVRADDEPDAVYGLVAHAAEV